MVGTNGETTPPGFDKKPSLQDQMGQIFAFMSKSQKENDFFKEKTIEKFGQLEASMRNLETQIGQLATASHTRTPGTIPSDTVPNPKGNEHCKAVTLRSGRNLDSMPLMDDQGSGISLMALKTARAIGLEERMEPIDIALQLVDHSIVKPTGIVEDVLVRIDKFIIPFDFIVLDMPEDKEVPILFGRPFLATGDVLLGAKDNSVTFRINGEQLTINVEKTYVGGESGKEAREVVTLKSPKV
ncbi:uncharacterized protein LOC121787855 [Salvia splendens]|uniref:uncharacterized protein LOC121787855 n=1 Tax=Salvia splendens TaxID=180675 RepID=UPI001C263600|nr:uncharacterized protein LOC121787855 [Salvia splendens]